MTLPAIARMPTVAYFSMEIHLDDRMPTYSGGLGVLAGDTLRAAADLGVPMVAVTLIDRKGYFHQRLDEWGSQSESQSTWHPEHTLEPASARVSITVEERPVGVRAWRYSVRGIEGHIVPVFLLDTDIPGNSSWDRTLTDHLYGGDDHYRLCQEVVLGIGGVEILRGLGYGGDITYHLNEGHASLLALALLEAQTDKGGSNAATEADLEAVRRQCVFTTHTPVPAGHDQFPMELVRQVLGERRAALLEAIGCCLDGKLNMTHTALRLSRYVNGVSMRHDEVSSGMFPGYPINAITNGVHAATWTSLPFCELYDRRIPEWRQDNYYLRYAIGISLDEISQAHALAKRAMLEQVKQRTGVALDESVMTIGFARRATPYKRADLLFSDLERLKSIARKVGPFQVVYGGKAHPRDESGKEMIRRVFQAAAALQGVMPVAYLENYDAALARHLCAGVDLWLNTPLPPQEASGTSGMKAALNGVPSLSILDGWWVEGHIEGVTGWAIGHPAEGTGDRSADAASLYEKFEREIIPLYYGRPSAYAAVMRSAIALNGAFFNAQRMVAQYVRNAYRVG